MFNDDAVRDLLRKYDQQDMLASVLRVGLSVAGPFGGVIGEFITHFVPRQRVSRLVEFIEHLNERLSGLEDQFKERLADSPGFTVLTEEATLAAVLTGSSQRRRDLAELLRTGLSRPEAELLDHEALLRLLERLNDAQVLILMNYGSFKQSQGDPARTAFRQKHANVFDTRPPNQGAPDEERRRWTMYRLFEDELVMLNLLRDTEGVIHSSPRRVVGVTNLGRILLHAIGRAATES